LGCFAAIHLLFFFIWNPQVGAPMTAGTHTHEGAVIRKPRSAWLEGTPAMDHGMNCKRIYLYLIQREIEHNTHQETRNMDEEHTR